MDDWAFETESSIGGYVLDREFLFDPQRWNRYMVHLIGIRYVQKHVNGTKVASFFYWASVTSNFSAASAAFGGHALPKYAQLTGTSYYAASSASHYGISLLASHVEEAHISRAQHE